MFYPYLSVEAVGGAIVASPTGDWVQLQQHRVNAAATADAFMNYVDRSRMVSHIIPVSGVSRKKIRGETQIVYQRCEFDDLTFRLQKKPGINAMLIRTA